MVRERKPKKAADIKLKQPDRSGPTEKTLLEIAQERGLFDMADSQQRSNKQDKEEKEPERIEVKRVKPTGEASDQLSPGADRVMETALYAVCLAMLHFTFDYLVQHQYAMEINLPSVITRSIQALFVFAALVYVLHPHPANTTVVPGLPQRYQEPLRQGIFFVTSAAAGCYLIQITNKYTYLAVLKQSPPLGCLWIWSVLEMNLGLSVLSLAGPLLLFWQKGYKL